MSKRITWAAASAWLALSPALGAQCLTEHDQELLPIGSASAGFGSDVDASDELLVVGAEEDSTRGEAAGSASVYRWEGDQWVHQTDLIPAEVEAGDRFGASVAASGSVLWIGAPGDDDAGAEAGAVYVFADDGVRWNLASKLTASDGSGGETFGAALDLGPSIGIVGASKDDAHGLRSGAAYVFRDPGSGWSEEQKLLDPTGAADDRFGFAVAIRDGFSFAGAMRDDDLDEDAGAVHVFADLGGSWVLSQTLYSTDGAARDFFGDHLAVDGDHLVVSAAGQIDGRVAVFGFDGAQWLHETDLSDLDPSHDSRFGASLAVSGDCVLVGAPDDLDTLGATGSAHLFCRDENGWRLEQKLHAAGANKGDDFGSALTLHRDRIVVTALGDDRAGLDVGAAHAFRRWCSACLTRRETQQLHAAQPDDNGSYGQALAVDGPWMLIGSPSDGQSENYGGSASILQRTTEGWVETQWLHSTNSRAYDRFGTAVALQSDLAIVGAPFDDEAGRNVGTATVFRRIAGQWLEEIELQPSPFELDEYFGSAVALDGNWLAVGSPGADAAGPVSSGQVTLFEFVGGVWLQQVVLTASVPKANAQFGKALALRGDLLAIGIPGTDNSNETEGSLELHRFDGSQWNFEQRLEALDPRTDQSFGAAVRLGPSRVVIGGPGNWRADGLVFVVEHDGTQWQHTQLLAMPDDQSHALFGQGIDLVGDLLAIGAPRDHDRGLASGAAFVFRHDGSQYQPRWKFRADDGGWAEFFGWSVGLAGDELAVGSPNDADLDPDDGSLIGGSASVFSTALALDASPDRGVLAGQRLDFSVCGGEAGGALLLAVVELNGTPLFLRLALGQFDGGGRWEFSGAVPPGLDGLEAVFRSFGFARNGQLEASNLETVLFGR